jgi:hypothetical protein
MTVLFGTSSEVFCVYRDQHFCPHSTSDLADARPPSPREKGSPLRGAKVRATGRKNPARKVPVLFSGTAKDMKKGQPVRLAFVYALNP